ncbi:MAG: polyprenyl synthetase family protein [Firmicutes bacterium]|nr:polyprenyl synthetase family protein [Alicyclobacillaceae bacterium]MCL6497492.1 polyprenyl synthetase family protein [Bacillota bacterium]
MGLFTLVESDLAAVDEVLTATLTAENPLVRQVAEYLLATSGKRLRPTLVLLASRFGRHPEAQAVRVVAAAVEMIHLATLVHDDIIDEATVRRGQAAVRQRFGNPVAVLAGDYLFARAFQLLSDTGRPDIVALAADIVFVMCQGEIAQNLSLFRETDAEEYRRRIADKTAHFLAQSCALGARAAEAPEAVEAGLARYGHHLGMAFQVVDDVLDWRADPGRLGKPTGGDIAGGVYTLPVLSALSRPEWASALRAQLQRKPVPIEEVRQVLEASGALDEALAYARREAGQAVEALASVPAGPAREALVALARFVVERDR